MLHNKSFNLVLNIQVYNVNFKNMYLHYEVSNSESLCRAVAFEYPFLISTFLGQRTCMKIIASHNSLAYANYH